MTKPKRRRSSSSSTAAAAAAAATSTRSTTRSPPTRDSRKRLTKSSFKICPESGERIVYTTATLKDIREAEQSGICPSAKRQLVRIPSVQQRETLLEKAAAAIRYWEEQVFPPYGGRAWKVHVRLQEKQSSSSSLTAKPPLFRWFRGKLELAVLPHLIEKVPDPIQVGRDWSSLDYLVLDPDGEPADDDYAEDILDLADREESQTSRMAWHDNEYLIPMISLRWTSPNRQSFSSRKAAEEHCRELVEKEILIDKVLHGKGARGQVLKPSKCSKEMALKVGILRFLRDGLWVVGQEEAWQQERADSIQAQAQEKEETSSPAVPKTPKTPLQFFLQEKRLEAKNQQLKLLKQVDPKATFTLREAEQRLRLAWKSMSGEDQNEWKQLFEEECSPGKAQLLDDEETTEGDCGEENKAEMESNQPTPKSNEGQPKQEKQRAKPRIAYEYYIATTKENYRDKRLTEMRRDDPNAKFTISQAKKELSIAWKNMEETEKMDWKKRFKLEWGNRSNEEGGKSIGNTREGSETGVQVATPVRPQEKQTSKPLTPLNTFLKARRESYRDTKIQEKKEGSGLTPKFSLQEADEELRLIWKAMTPEERARWNPSNAAEEKSHAARNGGGDNPTETGNSDEKIGPVSAAMHCRQDRLAASKGIPPTSAPTNPGNNNMSADEGLISQSTPKSNEESGNPNVRTSLCSEDNDGASRLEDASGPMGESTSNATECKEKRPGPNRTPTTPDQEAHEEENAQEKSSQNASTEQPATSTHEVPVPHIKTHRTRGTEEPKIDKECQDAVHEQHGTASPGENLASSKGQTDPNPFPQKEAALDAQNNTGIFPSVPEIGGDWDEEKKEEIDPKQLEAAFSSRPEKTYENSLIIVGSIDNEVENLPSFPEVVASQKSVQMPKGTPEFQRFITGRRQFIQKVQSGTIKLHSLSINEAYTAHKAAGEILMAMNNLIDPRFTTNYELPEKEATDEKDGKEDRPSKSVDEVVILSKRTRGNRSGLQNAMELKERNNRMPEGPSRRLPKRRKISRAKKKEEPTPAPLPAQTLLPFMTLKPQPSNKKETPTSSKKRKRSVTPRRFPPSPRWRLSPHQIQLCYDAALEHYDNVMNTVKARGLHSELEDGFDLLRERGRGRYDMELPAFDEPCFGFFTDLRVAPWMPIVKQILGPDVLLIHKGVFLSMPGADTQNYHQDGPHLTQQYQRACHAINVFVPLVDLTLRNGPTEFILGSHILDYEDYDKDKVEIPQVTAGTPVIFDYRLGHRGLANTSDSCRPILYCTYTASANGKEFRDSVNFSRKRYHRIGDLVEKPLSRDERTKKRRLAQEERECLNAIKEYETDAPSKDPEVANNKEEGVEKERLVVQQEKVVLDTPKESETETARQIAEEEKVSLDAIKERVGVEDSKSIRDDDETEQTNGITEEEKASLDATKDCPTPIINNEIEKAKHITQEKKRAVGRLKEGDLSKDSRTIIQIDDDDNDETEQTKGITEEKKASLDVTKEVPIPIIDDETEKAEHITQEKKRVASRLKEGDLSKDSRTIIQIDDDDEMEQAKETTEEEKVHLDATKEDPIPTIDSEAEGAKPIAQEKKGAAGKLKECEDSETSRFFIDENKADKGELVEEKALPAAINELENTENSRSIMDDNENEQAKGIAEATKDCPSPTIDNEVENAKRIIAPEEKGVVGKLKECEDSGTSRSIVDDETKKA